MVVLYMWYTGCFSYTVDRHSVFVLGINQKIASIMGELTISYIFIFTAWILPDGRTFPVGPWQWADGTYWTIARCVTEAFSTACTVHIWNCDLGNWWLSSGCSSALVTQAQMFPSFHILSSHCIMSYTSLAQRQYHTHCREHLPVTVMGSTSVKVEMLSAGRSKSTWQRYW